MKSWTKTPLTMLLAVMSLVNCSAQVPECEKLVRRTERVIASIQHSHDKANALLILGKAIAATDSSMDQTFVPEVQGVLSSLPDQPKWWLRETARILAELSLVESHYSLSEAVELAKQAVDVGRSYSEKERDVYLPPSFFSSIGLVLIKGSEHDTLEAAVSTAANPRQARLWVAEALYEYGMKQHALTILDSVYQDLLRKPQPIARLVWFAAPFARCGELERALTLLELVSESSGVVSATVISTQYYKVARDASKSQAAEDSRKIIERIAEKMRSLTAEDQIGKAFLLINLANTHALLNRKAESRELCEAARKYATEAVKRKMSNSTTRVILLLEVANCIPSEEKKERQKVIRQALEEFQDYPANQIPSTEYVVEKLGKICAIAEAKSLVANSHTFERDRGRAALSQILVRNGRLEEAYAVIGEIEAPMEQAKGLAAMIKAVCGEAKDKEQN